MNLMFWKKKKKPEEDAPGAADETVIAGKTDATPEKPGFWTRLKATLSRSNKKIKPAEEEKAEPSARRKDDKHPDKETDAPLPKPGFLARLKSALMPSRKKNKTAEEEKPDERKSSAKRTDRNHPNEEPQPSNAPPPKSMKRLAIALATLIPLAAGGGFFAATKLAPQQQQEVPTAKPAASQEIKTDGQPESGPAEAAKQAPPPEPEQPPSESAPPQPAAETPVAADAPAPAGEDIQAQIQAMKKQNLEMQAQIEALKKQPPAARPARSAAAATPREGVLIINGKDTKESVHGLKKVIESMNAASGTNTENK